MSKIDKVLYMGKMYMIFGGCDGVVCSFDGCFDI